MRSSARLNSGVQTTIEARIPNRAHLERKRLDHRDIALNRIVEISLGGNELEPESVPPAIHGVSKDCDTRMELSKQQRQVEVSNDLELRAQARCLTAIHVHG